ncbi:MAG: hypothetical protein R3352_07910 [Salinisphaeraceae bacterium]|nr:hypothetical protein [Salinisphaeraceae bacterium]
MDEPTTGRQEYVQELKAERDALRVKLHLVSMDLKDEVREEWHKLEHYWAKLKANAKQFGHEVQEMLEGLEDDLDDVADDVEDLGEEILDDIRRGYQKIRSKLD